MRPANNGVLGTRRRFLQKLALLGSLAAMGGPASASLVGDLPLASVRRRDKRPNMIVIMGDDIGYSDIAAFGGEIDTPNLDALVGRSVSFTNFYNMSRCCPSRAALLTGRYPHRVNMAGNGTSLSLDVPTVAEELRRGGYATTMVGKWHLTAAEPIPDKAEHLKWLNHQGHFDRDFGDRRTYPAARGFQHHWGIIWGVVNYHDPFSLVDDFTPVRSVPKDFYFTDAISDHAVREVQRLAKGRDPFMMYLAYTAAHWPLMAPAALIEKYIPRFASGWNQIRRDRYARQVKLGLVDPAVDRLDAVESRYEHNDSIAWERLTDEQRAVQVRKMATHAAMIEVMDQGIGRLVQALKDSGQYDDTLIVFTIDNGASPEVMVEAGYDRWSETRDGRKVAYGEYPAHEVGDDQTMACIGAQWASAANTPWRYWKAESYQGGTHAPFLMSWPAAMAGRAGTRVSEPAHIVDVTPTLLDIAGVTARTDKAPIDGISLAGVFQGKPIPAKRPFYFEHYGARAIIDGRWKLVSLAPGAQRPDLHWALYDLENDRTETQDVRPMYPEVVARLDSKWTEWAKAVGVPPRGGVVGTPPVQGFSD
ncbi:arylsulfatase [Sphingomonas sp. MMS12-HWE2-04]|uniref:arylsulfatase n=1 Tax=Sphingomonas sp. MMS12-HWE2-04 TaxID=3234199 RepID=UPI00384A63F5